MKTKLTTLLLLLISVVNYAQTVGVSFTENNLNYTITSLAPNEVQVTGGNPPSDLTIPSIVSNGVEDFTVTSIANNALSNKNLTSVILPNTVADTGFAAFSDNNLTSVVLPEGISIISKQSFQNNELTSIELPNTITKVDNNAFRNNQLTEVTLPANVNTIGTQTFENNPITEVTSLNTTPPSIEGSSFSNRDAIRLEVPESAFDNYNNNAQWDGFFTINGLPIQVGSIFTFNDFNYKITSISPNEVEIIGRTSSSTSLIIPSITFFDSRFFSVNSVGDEAFRGNSLDNVVIPSSITSIGNSAFRGCGIENLTLQEGLIGIGEGAFQFNNLTTVTIPNSVTTIGISAFQFNNLTNAVISKGITRINAGEFRVNKLTSIVIPDNITTIENSAFQNNNLTSVVIGSGILKIRDKAFQFNPLTQVLVKATTPPEIKNETFGDIRSNIDVFVPLGTRQAYLNKGWTDFKSVTEIDFNVPNLLLTANLQGASLTPNTGEENLMRDDLRTAGLLPTTSPYEDGLTADPTVFETEGTNAIVDWVFVELRDAEDSSEIIASTSALIQRDGDVVSVDGTSPISFTQDEGNYFLSIKHRNHLTVISASTINLSTAAIVLNFKSDTSLIAGGSTAMAEVSTGVFALFSGNFDGDIEISLSDRNSVRAELGEIDTYSNADADLNGAVELSDINSLLNINLGNREQF